MNPYFFLALWFLLLLAFVSLCRYLADRWGL